MNIIHQSESDLDQLGHSTHGFIKLLQLPQLLRLSNVKKHKGVHFESLLEWLIMAVFQRFSLYRAPKNPDFTTKTVRNLLNNANTNWQRLTILTAKRLIQWLTPLMDARRCQAFIIDDSLFQRNFSKKTELLARIFDHDHGKYLKGFRALTLGWSDGNTFLPVNYALMSSKNPKNRLGQVARTLDKRTLAGQRRLQAQRPMSDVALELLKQALTNGIKGRYVLFDSWFASPKTFAAIKALGCDGIGMLKRTSKVAFRYRNRETNVKLLFTRLKHEKWSQHPKNYLYSPVVTVQLKDGTTMKLKLVYVVNRHKNNQYLVLATSRINLKPAQIIQLYARRWQIEGYFKVAKQYLQFDRTQIQNYDGLCGHLAITAVAYDLLALQQRENQDDRTIGDLFFIMGEPLPDIRIAQALDWLMTTLTVVGQRMALCETVLTSIFDHFMQTLPINLIQLLGNAS